MKLTDLLPLEKWAALENEIARKYDIDVNVFNTEGVRITDVKNWANRLCPAIKATDKGQSFICAVAHMNIAGDARELKEAVIEECDAGMMKLVAPIFIQDEYLGALGACGVLLDEAEAEAFLINKITDIEEEEIESRSKDLRTLTMEAAEVIKEDLTGRIERIVKDALQRLT